MASRVSEQKGSVMALVATVTFGVGSNFVHLVSALVLAWGFVVGQVCVYGITTRKGR